MDVTLHKFKTKKITEKTSLLFIGSFDETLIKHLLRKIPNGIIITNDLNYSMFSVEKLNFDNCNDKLQKVINQRHRKQDKMFILFDCLNYTISNEKLLLILRQLFMNGSIYNICTIMITHNFQNINPCVRLNTDFVFINSENDIKEIYKNFAGIVPNFKTFKKVVQKCIQNNKCLVINNTNKIEFEYYPLDLLNKILQEKKIKQDPNQ